jgi:hypothetical protein
VQSDVAVALRPGGAAPAAGQLPGPPARTAAPIENWIARTLTTIDSGVSLLGGDGSRLAVPADELPETPSTWRIVNGSRHDDAHDRFVAYETEGNHIVTLHSVAGTDLEPPGRLIALVTLGRHRVSVIDAGPGRFEARWDSGTRRHCLAVAATTLGPFMSLVLNLCWP